MCWRISSLLGRPLAFARWSTPVIRFIPNVTTDYDTAVSRGAFRKLLSAKVCGTSYETETCIGADRLAIHPELAPIW